LVRVRLLWRQRRAIGLQRADRDGKIERRFQSESPTPRAPSFATIAAAFGPRLAQHWGQAVSWFSDSLALQRLPQSGAFAMPPRIRAVCLGLAALLVTIDIAQAQLDERQQMLSGGAPRNRSFNLFGFTGSDVSRTRVSFASNHRPGTIVINTAERRLYLVQDGGIALRYAIGVGRVGFTWKGVRKVTEKKEWPGWTPPPQMLKRRPDLPRHMA